MGEWSDYFEQFPDENPANQIERPDGPSSRAPTLAEQRAAEEMRQAAREALRRSARPIAAKAIRRSNDC